MRTDNSGCNSRKVKKRERSTEKSLWREVWLEGRKVREGEVIVVVGVGR